MAKRKATESEPLPTKKPSKSVSETTVSICIPSTVISPKNAYNLQQITNIIYQIAKACTIYKVAEIVVFDVPELNNEQEDVKLTVVVGSKVKFVEDEPEKSLASPNKKSSVNGDDVSPSLLVASLLQFFITPPYLVKTMFSSHLNSKFKNILPKFTYAFKLPKITTLPFMQNNQVYKVLKEGMIIPRETPLMRKKNKKTKSDHKITVSKYVNIGEKEALKLEIKREIPIYSRVTVDLKNKTVVSPLQAYGVIGHKAAFGYHVRMASEFNKIFTQSPISDGYSSTIYVNCDDYFGNNNKIKELDNLLTFKEATGNVLMVLGNYKDLQAGFKADSSNVFQNVENVAQLFDSKLNIPDGCRIEDAILISLAKVIE